MNPETLNAEGHSFHKYLSHLSILSNIDIGTKDTPDDATTPGLTCQSTRNAMEKQIKSSEKYHSFANPYSYSNHVANRSNPSGLNFGNSFNMGCTQLTLFLQAITMAANIRAKAKNPDFHASHSNLLDNVESAETHRKGNGIYQDNSTFQKLQSEYLYFPKLAESSGDQRCVDDSSLATRKPMSLSHLSCLPSGSSIAHQGLQLYKPDPLVCYNLTDQACAHNVNKRTSCSNGVMEGIIDEERQSDPSANRISPKLVKLPNGIRKSLDKIRITDFIDSATKDQDLMGLFNVPREQLPYLSWVKLCAIQYQKGRSPILIFQSTSKKHRIPINHGLNMRDKQAARMIWPNFGPKSFKVYKKHQLSPNPDQLFYVYNHGWSSLDPVACQIRWKMIVRRLKVEDICLALIQSVLPEKVKNSHVAVGKCFSGQSTQNDLCIRPTDCRVFQEDRECLWSDTGVCPMKSTTSSQKRLQENYQVSAKRAKLAGDCSTTEIQSKAATDMGKAYFFMASNLAQSGLTQLSQRKE